MKVANQKPQVEDKDEVVTAWVTKFALTTGIFRVTGRIHHDISSGKFCYGWEYRKIAHGIDWYRTKKDAIVRAEKMRSDKINSLKKSILKLEALKFE